MRRPPPQRVRRKICILHPAHARLPPTQRPLQSLDPQIPIAAPAPASAVAGPASAAGRIAAAGLSLSLPSRSLSLSLFSLRRPCSSPRAASIDAAAGALHRRRSQKRGSVISDMAGTSSPGEAPATRSIVSMQANEIENLMESTYQNYHASVMKILIKDSENCVVGMATGFVVYTEANKNLVMTCDHNFTDFNPSTQKAVVRLSGRSEEFAIVIEYRDDIHDLLLFSVSGVSCPSLVFSDDDVLPGSPVMLLGYLHPDLDLMQGDKCETTIGVLVKDPSVIPGNILGVPYVEWNCPEFHEEITYDCAAFRGSSGSPVLMGSKVIGVHHGHAGNFREACSSNTVTFVLRKWLGFAHDDQHTIDEMIALLAAKIREQ